MSLLKFIGLVFLIFGALESGGLEASELFAPAPVDEVSVRTLPAFTVLETDTTGSLDAAWQKGFRLGARFAVRANSGLNTPVVITLPDWEKTPVIAGANVHVLVQCLLDPLPNFPTARDEETMVRDMPDVTVACYAERGDYTPDAFLAGLNKIEAYMKARHIPQVGPPRYLYYVTTNWMPSWWRVGEVQVPIAARAGG